MHEASQRQSSLIPGDGAPDINESFTTEGRVVLHLGDSYNFMRSVPSNIATLIITSPPYNVGKEYERKQNINDYLRGQEKVIDELVRVLSDQGSLCWQVGNFAEDGEVFPLDIWYYPLFKKRGLKLRNRIVWHYSHGLHPLRRFSGRYETILWFTKGDKYKFNLDPIRVPSKYPGKRHYKGPNKGKPSGNPLGKNPSDIWEIVAEEWDKEIWYIPNVKAAHPEKTTHPSQFPVELVERFVLALTDKDDWVIDPYCGVGSSLIAGLKQDRRTLGCDKEAQYIKIAKERIQAFYEGKLPLRPIDRQLYVPNGRVARWPDEWRVTPTEPTPLFSDLEDA
jgi:adenine-specific DNA-methyltransferase